MTRPPSFIVFSRPRCGSTALCQALNAHRDVTCLFEPSFQMTAGDVAAVSARIDELRGEASGFKHVWEHAGPPFWPAAPSDVQARLAQVRAANLAILRAPGVRIVALYRRDQWARAVSHLLSLQTDQWGLVYRDGRWELADPSEYRASLGAMRIAPLDIEILDWYLGRGTEEERALMEEAARSNPSLELAYEDLLGAHRSQADRLHTYLTVLEFLGLSTDRSAWNEDVVRALFAADRKLNNRATFALIPNIRAVEARREAAT